MRSEGRMLGGSEEGGERRGEGERVCNCRAAASSDGGGGEEGVI